MQLTFKGVTFVNGPADQVKGYVNATQERNVGTVTATIGGQGVILDGKDAEVFLKREYDVTLPNELKDKSKDEAGAIISGNIPKYMPLIQKLMQMVANPIALLGKIFDYAETAKTANQDADGQPIQEVQL